VRVERQAAPRAGRYYANGGKCDPVLIDLPLGSYMPAFHRNTIVALPDVAPPAGGRKRR
jgi:hypothetical protein